MKWEVTKESIEMLHQQTRPGQMGPITDLRFSKLKEIEEGLKRPLVVGVLATTPNGGIGLRGGLPWQLAGDEYREDMISFVRITSHQIVVAGSKTAIGLPLLRRRACMVLSSRKEVGGLSDRWWLAGRLEEAERAARLLGEYEKANEIDFRSRSGCGSKPRVCVIGGGETLLREQRYLDALLLTTVSREYESDVYVDRKGLLNGMELFESHEMDDGRCRVDGYVSERFRLQKENGEKIQKMVWDQFRIEV